MKKIQSQSDLEEAILFLESKQAVEENMLREQLQLTYEGIKPLNIIKNTFKEALESQDLKVNLLNTSIGFGVGFLSKIIYQGIASNPIKKLLGNALMLGVNNVVAKNPEVVKTLATIFLKILHKKSNTDVHREVVNDPIDLEIIY